MRINVSLPDEVLARVDRVRGDVSRSRWVLRAVEAALGGPKVSVVPFSEPLTEESVRHLEAGTAPSRSVPAVEAVRRYAPKRSVTPRPKKAK